MNRVGKISASNRVFNSALHLVELEILAYRLGTWGTILGERIEKIHKPFDDAEFITLQIPMLGEGQGEGLARVSKRQNRF